MSKKIYANVDASSASANNKPVATSVNGNTFDSTGALVINAYTKEEFENIVNVLPVSHYNYSLVAQDVDGFVVDIDQDTQVLLSGRAFNLPAQNIDLSTV